jgi:4-amino-4-deoxy-L-arabinose transferase-like glycosyltransferase
MIAPGFNGQSDAAPRPWLVLLLCLLFAFAGITGHDPWKTDDAVNLGIAHGFLTGGHWAIPTLAGETLAEAEPLYGWLAATLATIGHFLLPFHSAARLASGVFTLIFLAVLGVTARRLLGRDEGWAAPLLAIGTLGLLIPVHEAQPASAVLAGVAVAYWGTALLDRQAIAGGVVLGAGLGATFLAGGLVAAVPVAVLLLLPLTAGRWLATIAALAAAVLSGGSWLWFARAVDPAYPQTWLDAEIAAINVHQAFSLAHLELISWFGWPVLYIALWTLWSVRRQILTPAFARPLLGLVAGILWFLVQEARISTLLPAIVPMILLATMGCIRLRRGAANAWDWFGMMTTTLVVGLVWIGAAGLYLGWPEKLGRNIQRLTPGFAAELWLPGLLAALAVTCLWLAMLVNLPRSPWRVAIRWAAGVTVVWSMLTALWLPWIDYGKTYRPLVASLRQALPADIDCLGRMEFGLGQRAALDYFAGLRTRPARQNCSWAIHQQAPAGAGDPAGWTRVWEGHRPGDRTEAWRLYRRLSPSESAGGST